MLRLLLLRDTDAERWKIVARMMDHKKEHRARAETWKFYKEKVVDFLRITCGLEKRFSEEEILHVLGALDVNSVRIHAAADNNIPVSIYHDIDCYKQSQLFTPLISSKKKLLFWF